MKNKTWKAWTKEDDEFMIKNYKTMIVKDIYVKLGRNKLSVINRAVTLGLTKSRKDSDFKSYISYKRRKEAGLLNETKIEKVERQNNNKYRYKERHRAKVREMQNSYRRKNYQSIKIKLNANKKAVRNVELNKDCDISGSTDRLQRHHWRYDKPLLVNTLCQFCHDVQHGRRKQHFG